MHLMLLLSLPIPLNKETLYSRYVIAHCVDDGGGLGVRVMLLAAEGVSKGRVHHSQSVRHVIIDIVNLNMKIILKSSAIRLCDTIINDNFLSCDCF